MRCDTYRALLHQMLDGVEIGEEERAQLAAHEKECDACRAQGDAMRAIHAQCAQLDEEVQVPEAVSQGWRRKIREEAAARRRRFSPRVLTGVAAALLVVAIGGTAVLNREENAARSDSLLMPRAASGMDSGKAYTLTAESMMADEVAPKAAAGDTAAMAVKRIRTASISLRTGEFDAAMAMLRTLPDRFSGYVSDEDMYGVAGEEARSASVSIRVEASQLDAFLEQIATLGEVRSRSVNTQDVTEAYADVSGRLESAKARRTRLNELVAQAQDVSELIELEAALSEVQETIEGYERTLAGWDTRVQYATVYVDVQETLDAQAAREGELGLIARIQGALADSVDGMVGFAQDALVVVIAALPWAALALLAALLVGWIFKRRKKPGK